ncbi:MAG: BON domain-containing protein [Polyangiaceae bacterium]|nr:BON domain-containing protein [Polyangiaceae bacterium]
MNELDMQMRTEIEEELRWNPELETSSIDLSVSDGVVSLFGTVNTYPEKWAAEDTAERVCGVNVNSEIAVRIQPAYVRSDAAIASAAHCALLCDVFVPNSVTAKVREGIVTLKGDVTWNYQRESAERATRYLAGVVSVSNEIALLPSIESVNDIEYVDRPSQVGLTPIGLITVQPTIPFALESELAEPEYDGSEIDVVFLAG